MKKNRTPFLWLVLVFGTTLLYLGSCKKGSEDTPVVKTSLNDSITAATNLLTNTVAGNNDGQYPTTARTTLQTAIDAAKSVNTSSSINQDGVNAAVVSLHNAMNTYRGAVVQPVAPESLIANWTFNEGTGTTATDISSHKFSGTFKTGNSGWGSGVAAWTTDRFGTANKAILFDKGANIQIPYNTLLNPKKITIALWVKNTGGTRNSKRFIGLWSWFGYKFELPDHNKPFFTVHNGMVNGSDTYSEEDFGVVLEQNAWHHIAASYDGTVLKFYIDGALARTVSKPNGDAVSISSTPVDLVIGCDYPADKYAATDANYDNDHIIPLTWGGYWTGSLDEVRMYNVALTDAQITAIYNREKP